MRSVELSLWPRREIFEFFSAVSNPFYMVTFRQDVTALCRYCRVNGLSFYHSMTYLVTKALNAVDAFHYVIEDGAVFRIPDRSPSFTALRPGEELFRIITMSPEACAGSIEAYCAAAEAKAAVQEAFIDLSQESNALVYISCLPWLDITAITNERDLSAPGAKDESVPHVAWGRYIEQNGRMELGISIEVNHRLIDGIHIGRFAQELTRSIEALTC